MEKLCYFKGQIVSLSNASLPLNDLGVLRGFGIFDYLRTYNGKPFLLSQHLDRFYNSMHLLGIEINETRQDIHDHIDQLLKRSDLKEAGLRLVVTGGETPDGFTFNAPSFFILIEPIPDYDNEVWTKGVKLMMHEYLRDVPEIKTINYIEALRLQPERIRKNAFDILYCYNGKILECTRSNFFLFHGDTLVTPKKNVLIGRTRNLIIELARDEFQVEERDVSVDELSNASEAFLSGTTKKVMPVNMIDEIKIDNGDPGKNTIKLQGLFDQYIFQHTNA